MDEPFFVAKLRDHLPLTIELANCQDGILVVSGSQWSFTATSSWRVNRRKDLSTVQMMARSKVKSRSSLAYESSRFARRGSLR